MSKELQDSTRSLIAKTHELLDVRRKSIEEDIRNHSILLGQLLGTLRGSVDHETVLMLRSLLVRLTSWHMADLNDTISLRIRENANLSEAEEVARLAAELEAILKVGS